MHLPLFTIILPLANVLMDAWTNHGASHVHPTPTLHVSFDLAYPTAAITLGTATATATFTSPAPQPVHGSNMMVYLALALAIGITTTFLTASILFKNRLALQHRVEEDPAIEETTATVAFSTTISDVAQESAGSDPTHHVDADIETVKTSEAIANVNDELISIIHDESCPPICDLDQDPLDPQIDEVIYAGTPSIIVTDSDDKAISMIQDDPRPHRYDVAEHPAVSELDDVANSDTAFVDDSSVVSTMVPTSSSNEKAQKARAALERRVDLLDRSTAGSLFWTGIDEFTSLSESWRSNPPGPFINEATTTKDLNPRERKLLLLERYDAERKAFWEEMEAFNNSSAQRRAQVEANRRETREARSYTARRETRKAPTYTARCFD